MHQGKIAPSIWTSHNRPWSNKLDTQSPYFCVPMSPLSPRFVSQHDWVEQFQFRFYWSSPCLQPPSAVRGNGVKHQISAAILHKIPGLLKPLVVLDHINYTRRVCRGCESTVFSSEKCKKWIHIRHTCTFMGGWGQGDGCLQLHNMSNCSKTVFMSLLSTLKGQPSLVLVT